MAASVSQCAFRKVDQEDWCFRSGAGSIRAVRHDIRYFLREFSPLVVQLDFEFDGCGFQVITEGMSTAIRSQGRYDHRLRELVREAKNIDVALQHRVPRMVKILSRDVSRNGMAVSDWKKYLVSAG